MLAATIRPPSARRPVNTRVDFRVSIGIVREMGRADHSPSETESGNCPKRVEYATTSHRSTACRTSFYCHDIETGRAEVNIRLAAQSNRRRILCTVVLTKTVGIAPHRSSRTRLVRL